MNDKRQRINDAIKISPVKLIGPDSEMIGVVSINEAKRRAGELGLDLVEIDPTVKPTICKIMDYGKTRFENKKRANKSTKVKPDKTIQLRPHIEQHDRATKIRQIIGFLEEGIKVHVTLEFKGREMAHKNVGFQVIQQFKAETLGHAKMISEPKMIGNKINMTIIPK